MLSEPLLMRRGIHLQQLRHSIPSIVLFVRLALDRFQGGGTSRCRARLVVSCSIVSSADDTDRSLDRERRVSDWLQRTATTVSTTDPVPLPVQSDRQSLQVFHL